MKILVEMVGGAIVAAVLMAIPILTGIAFCLGWRLGFCIVFVFWSILEFIFLWCLIARYSEM